ncbi:hypothetical protein MOBT1_001395 [Malassezia obtusa]|uniref:Uncharacterized protein n=1 Tax=Malassezia obtusa TaxID=76774 RepID=A0AAF0DZX8_9BASI|nr:hypothetical protein MOBT1_001395 [Malassezia obtusa]
MSILTVNYYRTHKPIIFPSWSSLIFLIVMGFLTCIIYFGYYIFLPATGIFQRGSLLSGLYMMKVDFLFIFAMCAIWISGALAYAADFRGHENCQFNGYYHYPKPKDWNHVCDMINWVVPLAYATFGVQAGLLGFVGFFLCYIFLFLDQDTINEMFWEWGQRAYNFQHEPPSALSSFNDPMKYRATNRDGSKMSGARLFGRGDNNSDMYEDYNEKRYYDEDAGRTGLRPGMFVNGPYPGSEKDAVSEFSSQYTSSGSRSRRGADYSDPSSASSVSDSTTIASLSNYHGGAYSRQSVNSRRAGLSDTPMPAGAGGTGSLRAPSWTPPSITSDGDTLRDSETPSLPSSRKGAAYHSRRVSTPASLGSRGRRGAAYSASEDGVDDGDYGTAFAPSDSFARSAETRTPGSRVNRTRIANAQRRRVSAGDETGWHLREN